MANQNKDLLRGAGVKKSASTERSRRPSASLRASTIQTSSGGQDRRGKFKTLSEANEVSATRRSAKFTTSSVFILTTSTGNRPRPTLVRARAGRFSGGQPGNAGSAGAGACISTLAFRLPQICSKAVAGGEKASAGGGGFRDIFSSMFDRAGGGRRGREPGSGSRIPGHVRFGRPSGAGCAPEYHSAGRVPDLRGSGFVESPGTARSAGQGNHRADMADA